ncbi:MAG TPA: 2-dehydropantoate 2-reductase [Chloroflexota bacterium]|jgi:2-dehydropantoate 2-reductase
MRPSLTIVGAGALGQAFAAHLALAGSTVTVLATPRSAATLLDAGRIRLRGASELDVPVCSAPGQSGAVVVTANAAAVPRGVGMVFSTKAHQLADACASTRVAEPMWVAGVQNGLVKDDILLSAFGSDRVLGMATIYSAGRLPSGDIAVSGLGRTYVGELDGRRSERAASVAALLCTAGIPTDCDVDMRSVSWSKACNAAGVFGVSVLTRTTTGEFMSDPDLLRAYLSLVRETAAIAAANGVHLGDYFGFPIRTYVQRTDDKSIAARPAEPAPGSPRAFPSMTQDLLAGRSLEAEEIFGDLVTRAERADVAAPRLRLVRDLCRGLDRNRRSG